MYCEVNKARCRTRCGTWHCLCKRKKIWQVQTKVWVYMCLEPLWKDSHTYTCACTHTRTQSRGPRQARTGNSGCLRQGMGRLGDRGGGTLISTLYTFTPSECFPAAYALYSNINKSLKNNEATPKAAWYGDNRAGARLGVHVLALLRTCPSPLPSETCFFLT